MKFGNSEQLLVEGLQKFREEQLTEITQFLKGIESTYERARVEDARAMQFAISNIKSLRKFIENFSVTFVYGENQETTGFAFTWDDRYGWDSDKSNVKYLMLVLNVIDKQLVDFERTQIQTIGTKCTPLIQVITNAIRAYENVVNMYATRNDE